MAQSPHASTSVDQPVDADDQILRHPSRATRGQKRGIIVGLVISVVLLWLADVTQVVELFNHPMMTVVLVAGVAAVLAGASFLARLWHTQPSGLTLVAVALTVVGSAVLGWVVGHTGSSTATVTDPPATSTTSPPSITETVNPSSTPGIIKVNFTKLRTGGIVHQRDQLLVTVKGGLPDGAVLRVFAREDSDPSVWPQEPCQRAQGTDSTQFICDGIYGDVVRSRGHLFELFAAILNSTDSQKMDELRSQRGGQGVGYPIDKPPFQDPVAESPTIYVHREG
jgi:hypothetical protein